MNSSRTLLIACACCALFTLVLLPGCGDGAPAPEQPKTAAVVDKAAAVVADKAAPTPAAAPAPVPVPAPAPAPAPAAAPAPAPAAAPDAAPAPAAAAAPEAAPAAATGPQPKFVCPEPTFDFGEKDASEVIKHDFVLRNEGPGVLEIKDVKPGCGCTTTQLESKTMQPGQEQKLATSLSLKGRQGKLTKTIQVTTNDPNRPSVTLTLVGTAVAPIMIDPEVVSIPRVEDDEPRSATVKVMARKEGVTFAVQSVEITGMDFMECETKEVTPGKEYSIEVRSKGALPAGFHNGRLLIRTDFAERPAIFCPISVQVVGTLLVMPPMINVRHSEVPGEKEMQQISVEPGRVKQFNITEVVTPVEGMKADINKLSENHYAIKLSDMPKDNSLEGKELILKTDVPTNPEMRVPFKVFKMRTGAEVLNAQKNPLPQPPAPTSQPLVKANPADTPPVIPTPAPAPAPAPSAK